MVVTALREGSSQRSWTLLATRALATSGHTVWSKDL